MIRDIWENQVTVHIVQKFSFLIDLTPYELLVDVKNVKWFVDVRAWYSALNTTQQSQQISFGKKKITSKVIDNEIKKQRRNIFELNCWSSNDELSSFFPSLSN